MAFHMDPEAIKAQVKAELFVEINGADELGELLVSDSSYPTNAEVEALWKRHQTNGRIDAASFKVIKDSLASLREERMKMSDKELKEHAFKGACAQSESALKTALQLADAMYRLGESYPMKILEEEFQKHSKDGCIDFDAFLEYLEANKKGIADYNVNMKKAFQDACESQDDGAKLQSKEQMIKALEALKEPTDPARMDKAWAQHAIQGKMAFDGFEKVVMDDIDMGNDDKQLTTFSSCCSLQLFC